MLQSVANHDIRDNLETQYLVARDVVCMSYGEENQRATDIQSLIVGV